MAPLFAFKKGQNFPFGPWTIVHGGQKIELAQKFMHVEVDMKYMQTNFCGRGSSGFGDFVPFHLPLAKFPFQTMDYSPWGQKIESPQNIHASKDMQAEMQAHAQSLVGVASHFLEILPNFSTSQKQK